MERDKKYRYRKFVLVIAFVIVLVGLLCFQISRKKLLVMFFDCLSKISTVIFRGKKDEARLELRKKYKFGSQEPVLITSKCVNIFLL